MENSKGYFEKEYGDEHVDYVVISGDMQSLYALIDEYANSKTATLQAKLEKAKEEKEELMKLLISVYFKTENIPEDLKIKIEKAIDFNDPLTKKIVC